MTAELNGRPHFPVSTRADAVFTHPKDLPDEYYRMWDSLIEGMQRDALGAPNATLTGMIIERVATLYTRLRLVEDGGARDTESATKLWRDMASTMSAMLEKHQASPEQRYMSGVKAAITAALQQVGRDATVAELLPVLVDELRQYDV
jgi:hypothetical protein